MAKGRDIAAESLNDVLNAALRRQQQGVLSVENQRGDLLVEGEIHVQNGRVTYARTHNLIGQPALREMLGWRQVRYAFLAHQSLAPAANAASMRPIGTMGAERSTGNLPSNFSPLTGIDNSSIPYTPPGVPLTPASGSHGTSPERDTGHIPEVRETVPSTPGLEWITPRRVDVNRDVLSLPLTRPQRSIYMLVDGNRSIGDLARCTRKTMQEIERLVKELQEHGLITI